MCGLVGAAGKIGLKEEKAFKDLLNFDTVRGPHSTGVAFTSTTGRVEVFKHLGTPWELYDHAPFRERWKLTHNMLMGHNRYATKGVINKNNAHPFEFDTIVGCHNGTLTKQYLLDDAKNFEVDSENIYYHMELNGVSDTIENLAGAFALVWYNKDEESLNFARNNQRPLFYCFSEDKKTIFWASEEWMLLVSLGRQNIKHGEVQEVNELQHYSFTVPLGTVAQAKPFEKARVRRLQPYVDPYPQKFYGNSYGGYSQPKPKTPPSNQTTEKKDTFKEKEEELRKLLNTDIDFAPLGVSKPAKDVSFIRGRLLGGNIDVDVRCYCYNRKDIWSSLSEGIANQTPFTGFVKAYQNRDGDCYLLLDNRTVEEKRPDEEEAEDLYTIQNGVMVSGKDFDEKTKQGCAWCSSPVTRDDSNSLRWIDSNEFLCEGCVDQPEVKEFVNLH